MYYEVCCVKLTYANTQRHGATSQKVWIPNKIPKRKSKQSNKMSLNIQNLGSADGRWMEGGWKVDAPGPISCPVAVTGFNDFEPSGFDVGELVN
jgi:hypothetical protein